MCQRFARSVSKRTVERLTGKGFATVGVSLDSDARDGVDFLERLGNFGEISSGRGWLNSASLDYVVRDLRGVLATPQLLVIERDMVVERTDMRVSDDRVLARYVGLEDIVQAPAHLD